MPIISENTTQYFTVQLFLSRVLFLRFLHHLPIENKTSLPLAGTEIVITSLKYPSVCLKQSFFYIAKRIWRKIKITYTVFENSLVFKIAMESKVMPLGRKTFRTCSLLSFPHLWDQIAFLGTVPDSFMHAVRQAVEWSICLENIWFLRRVLKVGSTFFFFFCS